jgi:hypothetical protein
VRGVALMFDCLQARRASAPARLRAGNHFTLADYYRFGDLFCEALLRLTDVDDVRSFLRAPRAVCGLDADCAGTQRARGPRGDASVCDGGRRCAG